MCRLEAVYPMSHPTEIGAAISGNLNWLKAKKGWRRYFGPKRAIILLLLLGCVSGGWYLREQGLINPSIIQETIADYPIESTTLFVLIYALSVMATLPTLPLNLAAGLLWGTLAGGLIATLGSGLGALLAFLAARLVFGQPLATRFDNRLVAWLQREFDQKGWRFIAFIRLNPVFPTGPLNYVLALTAVPMTTYAWASFVFLLPPSLGFALIGDQAGTYLLEGETADTVRTILLVSAAITLLFAVRIFARYLDARPTR